MRAVRDQLLPLSDSGSSTTVATHYSEGLTMPSVLRWVVFTDFGTMRVHVPCSPAFK
jgi:hypothetical protein